MARPLQASQWFKEMDLMMALEESEDHPRYNSSREDHECLNHILSRCFSLN